MKKLAIIDDSQAVVTTTTESLEILGTIVIASCTGLHLITDTPQASSVQDAIDTLTSKINELIEWKNSLA